MPFDKFRWYGVTYEEARAGCYNGEERVKDMDRDGVYAEVLFPPQRTMSHFLGDDDDDFVLAGIEAYNNFLFEEFCAPAPSRLIGLAQIPSLGIDTSIDALRKAKARGAKGVLISNWPSGADNLSRDDDPFWAAAVDEGLPVSIHINIISRRQRASGRKAAAKSGNQLYDMRSEATRAKAIGGMSHVFSMAAGNISSMLFTGVFERFPELQVCWIETGVGWIPHLLESLDDRWWRNRVWGDLPAHRAAVVLLVPQQRGVVHHGPFGHRAPPAGRRAQHHVVERLPAPRQRLAVLAQGDRGDDGPPPHRGEAPHHRRQRGAHLGHRHLSDPDTRATRRRRARGRRPLPVWVSAAVFSASNVSRWIVRWCT